MVMAQLQTRDAVDHNFFFWSVTPTRERARERERERKRNTKQQKCERDDGRKPVWNFFFYLLVTTSQSITQPNIWKR